MEGLGWNEHWAAKWQALDYPGWHPARVTRIEKGGMWFQEPNGTPQLAVAASRARRPAVGDWVGVDRDASRIEVILPRATVFERRSPGVDRDNVAISARALAANADAVLVVHGLDAGVNSRRLTRELVLAWESGAQPYVVLNKRDLVDDDTAAAFVRMATANAPGAPVLVASTTSPEAMAPLRDIATEGSTLALLGPSGAGKSSLVNALAGQPVQLTAEVRHDDRRGRHTTTAGRLVPLQDGALLIDTPGIRAVGLWQADRGLEAAFADLAPYAHQCRFRDCRHRDEPDCQLRAAVEAGEVSAERVEHFQALVDEVEDLEERLEGVRRVNERSANRRSRARARRVSDRKADPGG